MCAMPSRRRAFTLVELLVVVGIIAVLVAILMPVLARAREQANRLKCAANLRSIGHGLTMYTQQYRHYPGAAVHETFQTWDSGLWPVRLRPFLGGAREVFHCSSRDERFRWSDNGPLPLVRAPRDSKPVAYGYEVGEPLIGWRSYFSYGYNCFGAGNSQYSGADNYKGLGNYIGDNPRHLHRELAASRVRVPEDMIAVADSTGDGLFDWGIAPFVPGYSHMWPGTVHTGGANVLFCDGHVTWYRQDELLVGDDAKRDPAQWHRIRRWNNDHGIGD